MICHQKGSRKLTEEEKDTIGNPKRANILFSKCGEKEGKGILEKLYILETNLCRLQTSSIHFQLLTTGFFNEHIGTWVVAF